MTCPAPVVESVDTLDLKSNEGQTSYQFKSGLEHTLKGSVAGPFFRGQIVGKNVFL